ncbi:MAG: agmatinase [Candidatus Omnitrophota bacterium]
MDRKVFLEDMGDEFSARENSEIVILPVPYDGTSTWVKGADKGPFALLEASSELELYDVETCGEVYRHGIFTHPPMEVAGIEPCEMVKEVKAVTSGLINEGKFVVTIGGEHSVSTGAVMAHSEKFDNMCVLQLDAHADLRNEYKGSPYNHACVMARVKEICPFVQVGIRSMSAEEAAGMTREDVFFAHEIKNSPDWIPRVVNRLGLNVYVSIDLDVFDPAFLPSTGTPQPGGLDWFQVTSLLRAVSESKNVVGFDVVELCPRPEEKSSDMLAASLVYKTLNYVFMNR